MPWVRVDLSRWSLTPELLTLLCLQAVHPRTRERLLALRDIVHGSCAAKVCIGHSRHISTVLKWIHDFNQRGPSALLFIPSGGVPAQRQHVAPLLHEAIEQARHSASLPKKNAEVVDESAAQPLPDPAPYVQPACRWTLRSLVHWLHMITGKLFCRETVRKVLRQLGHSWKKARKLLGKACPTRRAEFVAQLVPLLEQSSQPDSPLVLFCLRQ